MKRIVKELAISLAREAIRAGGSSPFTVNGKCILPTSPLPGDWEIFEAMMTMECGMLNIQNEDEKDFEEEFRSIMEAHIGKIC